MTTNSNSSISEKEGVLKNKLTKSCGVFDINIRESANVRFLEVEGVFAVVVKTRKWSSRGGPTTESYRVELYNSNLELLSRGEDCIYAHPERYLGYSDENKFEKVLFCIECGDTYFVKVDVFCQDDRMLELRRSPWKVA